MGFLSFVSQNIEILSNSFRIYFSNFSRIVIFSAILNILFFIIRELLVYIILGFAYMITLIFIMNYLVSVIEVNILEQYRGINVFKRAISLVKDRWFEAFGFNFLRILAWFGFSFAITLIIILLTTQIFPLINLNTRAIDSNIQIELKLVQLVVTILTQPLFYIAGVVWYYQTRLTRENVDVRTILT